MQTAGKDAAKERERVKEQQIKDDEKAYINEKMSRQKSNWKDDLTEV